MIPGQWYMIQLALATWGRGRFPIPLSAELRICNVKKLSDVNYGKPEAFRIPDGDTAMDLTWKLAEYLTVICQDPKVVELQLMAKKQYLKCESAKMVVEAFILLLSLPEQYLVRHQSQCLLRTAD